MMNCWAAATTVQAVVGRRNACATHSALGSEEGVARGETGCPVERGNVVAVYAADVSELSAGVHARARDRERADRAARVRVPRCLCPGVCVECRDVIATDAAEAREHPAGVDLFEPGDSQRQHVAACIGIPGRGLALPHVEGGDSAPARSADARGLPPAYAVESATASANTRPFALGFQAVALPVSVSRAERGCGARPRWFRCNCWRTRSSRRPRSASTQSSAFGFQVAFPVCASRAAMWPRLSPPVLRSNPHPRR